MTEETILLDAFVYQQLTATIFSTLVGKVIFVFFSTNGEEKHQKFKLQVDQIQCSESKWIVFKAYNRFSYFWGYFQDIKCTHSNSEVFSNKIILLSK